MERKRLEDRASTWAIVFLVVVGGLVAAAVWQRRHTDEVEPLQTVLPMQRSREHVAAAVPARPSQSGQSAIIASSTTRTVTPLLTTASHGGPTASASPASFAATRPTTDRLTTAPVTAGHATTAPSLANAQPVAPNDSADAPQLNFLKTVGKPVWDGEDRAQWLRSHRSARLVAQVPATGFAEYVEGNNLAKSHAVFMDDRMILLELMVLRAGPDQANQQIGKFEDALGPADLDSPPANLSDAERSDLRTFRQWDVRAAGRRIIIRCMVRGGEARDGTILTFFQQSFADLDAAEAGAAR